jgi:hypothetical protein
MLLSFLELLLRSTPAYTGQKNMLYVNFLGGRDHSLCLRLALLMMRGSIEVYHVITGLIFSSRLLFLCPMVIFVLWEIYFCSVIRMVMSAYEIIAE